MKNILFIFLLFVLAHCNSIKFSKTENKIVLDEEEKQDHNKLAKFYSEAYLKNQNSDDGLKAANYYRLSRNFDQAIKLYKKLIDQNIHLVDSYEGLILLYIEIGEITEAKEHVSKILSIDATRWKPINAFALLLSLNTDYKQALKYYDLALMIQRNYSILNNKALTMAFNGDLKRSTEIMEEAADSISNDHINKEKIAMNLALVYGLNNHMEKAKQILLPYLNEEQIYNNLAIYSILVDDQEKAKQYLFKALDSNNHYQQAEDNLGLINQ